MKAVASPVRRIPPALALILTSRHEAIVSALRADRPPETELPSIYRLARSVGNDRAPLELYAETS